MRLFALVELDHPVPDARPSSDLETVRRLRLDSAVISNFGGFFGGWLSLWWIKRSLGAVAARRRAVWVSAAGALVTLLLPFAPDARWATAVISLSFFFALAGAVNIYAIPIDLYGAARSGLAVAALTCSFGILQTTISPLIGYLSDHQLYSDVVWLVTIAMLLAAVLLAAVNERTGRLVTVVRD